MADILPKNDETFGYCHFSADKLHLADFQQFFGKVLAHIWKVRSIWHIIGKKEVFGTLLEFIFGFSSEFWANFGVKLDKN